MVNDQSRVRLRQQATKERIFRSAMELFKAKGFAATTVSEIAELADIGKGTFFVYFPTKEAVVAYHTDVLMGEAFKRVTAAIGEGASSISILKQLIDDISAWHEENWELHTQVPLAMMMAHTEPDGHDDSHLMGLLHRLAVQGQTDGGFRSDISSGDIAALMLATTAGILLLWTREAASQSARRTLGEMLHTGLDLLLNGLAPSTRPNKPANTKKSDDMEDKV